MQIKNLKILLIRILPFIFFGLWVYTLIFAYYGFAPTSMFYNLFGVSLLPLVALWLISESDKHYHCWYMRLLYLSLILSQIISIIELRFNIIKDVYIVIYILSAIIVVTIIILLYLCFKHFKRCR